MDTRTLYVRCDVTGNVDVDNVFFDIFEMDQGTVSELLCNGLKNSLRAEGLDDDFL